MNIGQDYHRQSSHLLRLCRLEGSLRQVLMRQLSVLSQCLHCSHSSLSEEAEAGLFLVSACPASITCKTKHSILIVKTLIMVTPIHLYRDVQPLWAIAPLLPLYTDFCFSQRFVLSSTKPTSPPPLFARPFSTQEPVSTLPIPNRTVGSYGSSPVIAERKPLGAGKPPPPPTRAIGLGDKLPPP